MLYKYQGITFVTMQNEERQQAINLINTVKDMAEGSKVSINTCFKFLGGEDISPISLKKIMTWVKSKQKK